MSIWGKLGAAELLVTGPIAALLGTNAAPVKAFKTAFKVSDAEMKQGARVFNLAKQNVAGYEDCAEQLVIVFKGNRKMLEDVLEGLFHIAKADGALHPREEEFLGQVARRFGLTDTATRSRPATPPPPSASPTKCWASRPWPAMRTSRADIARCLPRTVRTS
jgi:Tellurite resistance protein TerB